MGAWEAKAEAERLVGVIFYPPGYSPERQLEKARRHNSRHIAMIVAYGRAAYAAGREAGRAELAGLLERLARSDWRGITLEDHGGMAAVPRGVWADVMRSLAAIEAARGDPGSRPAGGNG